tara:strand:- start:278 stop:583 length:306 start_codon:yes stop_codon:yes gene_type:complete
MKIVLMMMATLILISCANKPIIDSRGGSGNIPHNAERQHDDMYTCKAIAEDNTNPVWEAGKKVYNVTRIRFLNLTPKAPDNYKIIMEKCLEGRGHQVLIWE